MESVIAIFDIGKKDKKFFLLNRDYEVVYDDRAVFQPVPDEDGFTCENLEEITRWIKVTFREACKMTQFNIEAINFTTYGSGIVNIAENGKPVTPLYDYLKPYPKNLLDEFLSRYGDRDRFSTETASPVLGFLNSGLQLYWIKNQKKDLFKKIKYSLFFPQYLSYLYTGKTYSEITSLGCHSALWDFGKKHPHEWLYKEKIIHLFPPLINTFNTETIRYKTRRIACGIGVHDSSAALIPYQLMFDDPFILIITGSWNITMNPFSTEPLTPRELAQDCLNYINYMNRPVRASRIYLGREHSHQVEKLSKFFGKGEDYYRIIKYDPLITAKLILENDRRKKFYPELMAGTGPFPQVFIDHADLSLFKNFEEAYHQLMLDLVSMQVKCIELARGNSNPSRLFIAGRLCQSDVFIKILAGRLKDMEVFMPIRTSVTPLGAAITMHGTWNNEKNLQEVLKFRKCETDRTAKLEEYSLL